MGKGLHPTVAREVPDKASSAPPQMASDVSTDVLVVCKPPLCNPPGVNNRLGHRLRILRAGRGEAEVASGTGGPMKGALAVSAAFPSKLTDLAAVQEGAGAVSNVEVQQKRQDYELLAVGVASEPIARVDESADRQPVRRARTMRMIPHSELIHSKLVTARSGSVGASMLVEIASLCSTAFESECAEQVRSATSIASLALGKAALGAVRSTSAASTCAMLVSLLRHPNKECGKAAILTAARDLDAGLLLKSVVRGLGGQDTARRWQAAANALRAARLVGAGRPPVLERLRGAGGIVMVVEIWRVGGANPDVAEECCALALLMAPAHGRQVATSGALDCTLSSWHRFGSEADRAPLLQVLSEMILVILPHMSEKPIAMPRLAAESLRTVLPLGPLTTVVALLKALAHMAHDPRLAPELTTTIDLPDLALTIISDPRWGAEVHVRRLAAESFIRPYAVQLHDASKSPHTTHAIVAGGELATSRPHELPEAAVAAKGCASHPSSGTLGSAPAANALRTRLEGWRSRYTSYHGSPSTEAPAGMREVPLLRFDADFESGSMGQVARLGAREYDVLLLPDSGSNNHIQWFCFRVRDMEAEVSYTFHLSNLNKPGSLFEEGCLPVVFSRKANEASGIGWSRQGVNLAYHLCDAGKRHRITFDLRFAYDDDEVFIAHAPPYTHSDLIKDLGRWPQVAKRPIAVGCGGREVTALSCGDPTKPHVCIIARAHPGETHASWVMRGILEFLLEGSKEAEACCQNVYWLLVPMLNPDGVCTGRTRTNLAGVDLNRHHHDDAAPETMGLRAALHAEADSGCRLLAFVDIHSHSRRRGIFAITNGNDADPLVDLMAAHTNLMDVAGTSRSEVRMQDQGVGRVAAAHVGYKYSLTLETSLCARHAAAGGQHLSVQDLQQVGKAVCLAISDLASLESAGEEATGQSTSADAIGTVHGLRLADVEPNVEHRPCGEDTDLAWSEEEPE